MVFKTNRPGARAQRTCGDDSSTAAAERRHRCLGTSTPESCHHARDQAPVRSARYSQPWTLPPRPLSSFPLDGGGYFRLVFSRLADGIPKSNGRREELSAISSAGADHKCSEKEKRR